MIREILSARQIHPCCSVQCLTQSSPSSSHTFCVLFIKFLKRCTHLRRYFLLCFRCICLFTLWSSFQYDHPNISRLTSVTLEAGVVALLSRETVVLAARVVLSGASVVLTAAVVLTSGSDGVVVVISGCWHVGVRNYESWITE